MIPGSNVRFQGSMHPDDIGRVSAFVNEFKKLLIL